KLSTRRWLPNLVSMRAKVEGKTRRVRVSTRCLKGGKLTKVISAQAQTGGGVGPLPHGQWWEAATPHQRNSRYLLLLLLGLLLHRASHLLPCKSSVLPSTRYLPFFFLVAFFLAIRSPPSAGCSEAHRFAPQVFGLLGS